MSSASYPAARTAKATFCLLEDADACFKALPLNSDLPRLTPCLNATLEDIATAAIAARSDRLEFAKKQFPNAQAPVGRMRRSSCGPACVWPRDNESPGYIPCLPVAYLCPRAGHRARSLAGHTPDVLPTRTLDWPDPFEKGAGQWGRRMLAAISSGRLW